MLPLAVFAEGCVADAKRLVGGEFRSVIVGFVALSRILDQIVESRFRSGGGRWGVWVGGKR